MNSKFALIIAFTLGCSVFLSAQSIPSKWNYLTFSLGWRGYIDIQNLGDTTILDQACKILQSHTLEHYYDLRYFSFEDRKIQAYSGYTGRFHLLYDFNLNAGDTLEVDMALNEFLATNSPSLKYTIDSTSILTIDSDTFKVLHLNQFDFYPWNGFWPGEKIVERIGPNLFFLPFNDLWEMGFELYCVEFDSSSTYEVFGISCDSFRIVSTENILLQNQALNIYPNPVKDQLHLQFKSDPYQAHTYQIIDINGKQIRHGYFENGQGMEETNNLPQGTYFVQCFDSNQNLLAVKKFVKWSN